MVCSYWFGKWPFLDNYPSGLPEAIFFQLARLPVYLYNFTWRIYKCQICVKNFFKGILIVCSTKHHIGTPYWYYAVWTQWAGDNNHFGLGNIYVHQRMGNKLNQNSRTIYLSEILKNPVVWGRQGWICPSHHQANTAFSGPIWILEKAHSSDVSLLRIDPSVSESCSLWVGNNRRLFNRSYCRKPWSWLSLAALKGMHQVCNSWGTVYLSVPEKPRHPLRQ